MNAALFSSNPALSSSFIAVAASKVIALADEKRAQIDQSRSEAVEAAIVARMQHENAPRWWHRFSKKHLLSKEETRELMQQELAEAHGWDRIFHPLSEVKISYAKQYNRCSVLKMAAEAVAPGETMYISVDDYRTIGG